MHILWKFGVVWTTIGGALIITGPSLLTATFTSVVLSGLLIIATGVQLEQAEVQAR